LAGDNDINGDGGDDVLFGYFDNDMLIGGTRALFYLHMDAGLDTIMDFEDGIDLVYFSSIIRAWIALLTCY